MPILLIENLNPSHYEVIETVILKYQDLFKIEFDCDIYLNVKIGLNNNNFINYIKTKYPYVSFSKPNIYDYYINITIYNRNINSIINKNNHIYIAHEVTNELKKIDNVYFLTPLCGNQRFIYADCLPFNNIKHKTNIPIYAIQGNFQSSRRNYKLLEKILSKTYVYDFKIKMIGRGTLPHNLNRFKDKIILKKNLGFIEFHKEFSDVYCLLPLITKKSHNQYYTNKLTSSINYSRGYNLKCLIDKDLQKIYELKNAEIFNDENDICDIFEKTLIDFYNKKIFTPLEI